MRLLVLGGTQFVGRRIVEEAKRKGHAITLFHRGKTNPGLFPDAEHLLGDRDGGLAPLRGRRWDVVIDVNGYVPRLVRDAVKAVDAPHYVYISTLSVLADATIPNQTESAPRESFENLTSEEVMAHYGALKAACEDVVERETPGTYAILRPGFIVGPWDHTGRFPYWLRRAGGGATMLAPGSPDSPSQFIDARDLGAFTVRVAEKGLKGTYHSVGPREPLTWGGLFDEVRRVTGADTRVQYVSYEFLEARKVALPMRGPGMDGLMRTSSAKAIAEGLTFRPLPGILRDTLEWDAEHGRRDVGLAPERERDLLEEWKRTKAAA